jgi:hypothetical protein
VEGKAGMVAIPKTGTELDLKAFHEGLVAELPAYARPLFVRCVEQLDLTGLKSARGSSS